MSSVSKRLNLLLLCIIFYSANVHAQVLTDTSSLLSEEYNPRIIVIPFTKKQFDKKEDIRVVWNKDFYKRIAVTKFKEAFDKRDVSTIDFDAGIIIAEDINNRNEYKREDFEQFFIENSGADVYVVVDVDTQRRITAESGQVGLKVRLIVTAYEVATGISLSNKVCESPEFYTDDVGKLVSKAVESCAGEFIATIERKWKIDILKYGRPVMIDIGFRKGSGNSMTTTSNGIYYDAAIEKLIKENAKNGKYSIQSSAEKKLFFNNVRIQLTDSTGNTFHVTEFANKLLGDFLNIGIKINKKEVRANSIYILID